MTVGMALLILTQGRPRSARVISPVPLEVNEAAGHQGTEENSRLHKAPGHITDAQKLWPAPLVCCALEHSLNML